MNPLRAGRIAYTNDLPLYTAFDEGAVAFPGTFTPGVPSVLNAALLAGDLDLSPVSAFFYAQHADRLALLPAICIGSRREVWSVILVSSQAPEQLSGARIAVTPDSASGRNLLRILLERRFGVKAQYIEDPRAGEAALRGEPALLIGDTALDVQSNIAPSNVYDLGELWHQWTGLDMVFAVWAARREVLTERPADVARALAAFETARAWGTDNFGKVLAAAEAQAPRGEGFYAAYYERLNYTFDAAAQRGLERFIAESVALGTLEHTVSTTPEKLDVAC